MEGDLLSDQSQSGGEFTAIGDPAQPYQIHVVYNRVAALGWGLEDGLEGRWFLYAALGMSRWMKRSREASLRNSSIGACGMRNPIDRTRGVLNTPLARILCLLILVALEELFGPLLLFFLGPQGWRITWFGIATLVWRRSALVATGQALWRSTR